ncbi:MAG: SDR family NAD(P)-dependent oxidoreductase [Myxococcales bacterium]|nr:SDR family NAD(P)-dependent oxidoreductase [Myxococcales bacterium]MDD9971036.1 SDR family NAD(P)-dependent oxidoreductase [Myxococcales bacterium]
MDESVQGRTVVITGAAGGIGRAWVRGFLKDGFRVVAADINSEGLSELAQAGALTRVTDVTSSADMNGLVDFAMEKAGRIDVLFNNAGIGSRRRIENLKDGEFERIVGASLFGTVNGLRAVIPVMRQQDYGRIVNTISRAPEIDPAGNAPHGATKAGVWVVTRVAAREVSDTDILVNGLIPGPTNTGLWGRDMPNMKPPEATYPTAHMLATLPTGGPNGKAFFNRERYTMYAPDNEVLQTNDLRSEPPPNVPRE